MAQVQQVIEGTSLDEQLINDGFNNLELKKIDVPEPGDHEVLIRITLRPINPTDFLLSRGLYGIQPPFYPGSEGVAVVERNGPGASKFTPGQRVVGAAPRAIGNALGIGMWRQFLAVPEDHLAAVPAGMEDSVAAQYFINPVTAIGLVDSAEVPEGKYLLQAAAGSALGRQAIQYAKHRGVKTINLVRRREQAKELRGLGADEVIDQSTEDVAQRVKDITGGEGAWAALDPVAGDFTGTLVKAVRKQGTVLLYGALSGSTFTASVMDMLAGGRRIQGFILGLWLWEEGDDVGRQRVETTLRLISDGVIAVPSGGRTYPLEQFREAIAASQKLGGGEKVFLEG